MEIASLKAFVLRRIKYGESSLIVSLFSEERGKLSVIAKGARTARSKTGMASILEPLNLIEAEVYFKPSREIQLISKADIISDFSALKSDLDRMETSAEIMRTLGSLVHENEPNPDIWKLINRTMRLMESTPIDALKSQELAFKARLLSALGYEPVLEKCAFCGNLLDNGGYFAVESGGIICRECGPRGIPLDPDEIRYLRELFDVEAEITAPKEFTSKLAKVIYRHGEYHTEKKFGG